MNPLAGTIQLLPAKKYAGATFPGTSQDWPPSQVPPRFSWYHWFGIVFMAFVALMILPFLLDAYLAIDS